MGVKGADACHAWSRCRDERMRTIFRVSACDSQSAAAQVWKIRSLRTRWASSALICVVKAQLLICRTAAQPQEHYQSQPILAHQQRSIALLAPSHNTVTFERFPPTSSSIWWSCVYPVLDSSRMTGLQPETIAI
jgi:hypothetical protein